MRGWLKPTLAFALALLTAPGCAADDGPRYLKIAGPAEVRLLPRGQVGPLRLGGLSGIAYDAATDSLVAVSDRGAAFSLPLTAAGVVAAIGRLGAPAGMNALRDAEAIRRTRDGAWLVAFERGARLLRYPGPAAALTRPPASARDLNRLGKLSYNGGIEAMAALADGRVLLISESGAGDARQAWVLDGEAATPRRYATDTGFDPTDAVALPDGRVLVLERRFNGLSVPLFSSRLAWISEASLDAAGPLAVERRRGLADLLPSENWEGMEIVDRPEGPELWLVSDDNFRWPQNTLLARIRLADLAPAPARE